jgi:hypothetical protein
MTDATPEEELAEALVPADEEPDPEEYEADERTRAVSDSTGTVYDELGEPEKTPHDVELAEGEDEAP